jgi:hypothetical protein
MSTLVTSIPGAIAVPGFNMTLAPPFSILTSFTTLQLPFGNFWNALHGGLSARAGTQIVANATAAATILADTFLIIKAPYQAILIYVALCYVVKMHSMSQQPHSLHAATFRVGFHCSGRAPTATRFPELARASHRPSAKIRPSNDDLAEHAKTSVPAIGEFNTGRTGSVALRLLIPIRMPVLDVILRYARLILRMGRGLSKCARRY